MSNPSESHSTGLCSTCNNFSTCLFRAKRGFDAVYCENYDDQYISDSGDDSRDLNTANTDKAESDFGDSAAPLKGLCVNCADRDCCTLPKPESGVWHCEEYR